MLNHGHAIMKLAAVLALLFILGPCLSADASGPPPGAVEAQLVDVIDGRMIDVSVGGRTERVVYLGIDTPPGRAAGGVAATSANSVLLHSGPVYLVEDARVGEQTYGSLLPRYVYLADGTFVNAELVARGWAQPNEYVPGLTFAQQFRQLAAQAAERKAGFWSPDPPTGGAMAYGMTVGTAVGAATLTKGLPPYATEIASLPDRTAVTVLRATRAGDWLEVRTPHATSGWIRADKVQMNLPLTTLIAAQGIRRPEPTVSTWAIADGAIAIPTRHADLVCQAVLALPLLVSIVILLFAEGPVDPAAGCALGVISVVSLASSALRSIAAGGSWWQILPPAAAAILFLALLVRAVIRTERIVRDNPRIMW